MTLIGAALTIAGASGAGLVLGYALGYAAGYITGEETGRRRAITGGFHSGVRRKSGKEV